MRNAQINLLQISYIFIRSFSQIVDIDECPNNPCHLSATCINTVGSYMCACDLGYSGDGFSCSGMKNIFLIKIKKRVILQFNNALTWYTTGNFRAICAYIFLSILSAIWKTKKETNCHHLILMFSFFWFPRISKEN